MSGTLRNPTPTGRRRALGALWATYIAGLAAFAVLDWRTGLVDIAPFDPGFVASFVALVGATVVVLRDRPAVTDTR